MKRGSVLLKKIDWWVGIPIVFLLSCFRRKKILNYGLQAKVGFLKTTAIGDTVLLSAVISDTKRCHPNWTIYLIVGKANYSIAKTIPNVDKLMLLDNPLKFWQLREKPDVDILLNCGQWPRIDALIGFLYPKKFHIGFKTSGQYQHYLFDLAVPHKSNIHEIDNFRNLVQPIEVDGQCLPFLKKIDTATKRFANAGPYEYVVVHPWASGFKSESREWASPMWSELISNIISKYNVRVLISGSREDEPKSRELVSMIGNESVESISGVYSLTETTSIIRQALLLISVNTGIMHVGAAVGAPTIGLCGPTNSNRWGPVGRKVVSVSSRGDGCGFLNLGFEYPKNCKDCMAHISVEDVMLEVSRLIFETRSDTGMDRGSGDS
jgi:ADP-heptose:LPS heptosyltransferase